MAGRSAGVDHLVRVERLAAAARTASDLASDARLARDQAIAEADAAGHSLGQLRTASGLAKSHVQRIVIEATARHQAPQ